MRHAPSRQRYVLLGFLFLHTLNTYMDRVCISAAKEGIARDLALSDQTMGYVFAAFSLGYALFQVPSGWLVDRFGPRKALAVIVSLWSCFTALTGAAMNALWLLTIRFLFGAGEAGAFPGAARAMYRWLPARERGIAQGIFHSGARIGSALSLFFLPLLIRAVGWRLAFLLTAAFGFVWVAAWWWWYRDDPGENRWVNPAELDYIRAGASVAVEARNEDCRPGELRAALCSRNMLLLMFQAFAGTFTFYVSVTWFLPYLTRQWGHRADIYAAIPPLIGAAALWCSGAAVSALHTRGHYVASRRGPAIFGKLMAATGLLLATRADSLPVFVLLFTLALAGVEFVTAAAWTTCMDVGGEHTGAVSAAMNMSGNVGATLSAVLFPFFMTHIKIPVLAPQAGTANSYFVFAAAMSLLAACAWIFIDPRKRADL